jgi:hypothetical protein
MKTLAAYQKSVEFRKVENDGASQQNGGPCGIRTHEDDWLVVENSNPRNSLPRRAVEK